MICSVFTVATPDLSPQELLTTAKEAGISAIEWRCTRISDSVKNDPPSFWGNNRCTLDPEASPQLLAELKAATAAHGLRSLAVVPYLTCGDLEETERILSVASQLGASYIRLGVPGYNGSRSYGELLEEGRAYIREAEKLARRYGIKGLVETHHLTIAPSASMAHRLVEGCDPDSIGVLYDPGNLVHEGFEQYRMGLELLGPYLAHVHVKNAGWIPTTDSSDPLDPTSWRCAWQPVANGIVPWKRVLADLKAVGYEGAFGIEDFSSAYSSSEMLQLFVCQMNAWWKELQ